MRKLICLGIIIGILTIGSTAFADEKSYNESWCSAHNGQTEVRNDDRTSVDCLTSEYAIETDYAHKWYEAIGQSLHYGIKTNKKPGILLIIKTEKDMELYRRLMNTIKSYSLPITVWTIN